MVVTQRLPPPQAGLFSEQLGASHDDQQDGGVPRPVGYVLDEVQERGFAPVDIVEHQHQRSAAGRGPRTSCAVPRKSPSSCAESCPRMPSTPPTIAAIRSASGSSPRICSWVEALSGGSVLGDSQLHHG